MSTSPPTASQDHTVAEVAGPAYTPTETGAAILLGVLALLISGLLGLLLSTLAEEHRLATSGIGVAAMLEALTTGLVTGLAGIVLKPKGLRPIAMVAALALVAVDLATTRASGGGIFAMRALAGLPQGVLLWIAIGFISRTVTPERWAAVLFTGMGITQLGAATVLSAVILPRFGANGGYVMLAGGAALGLPVALFLPRALGAVPGQEGHGAGAGAPPLKGWIALLGTLCFAAPLAAVAVYVVPLARQAGLSVGAGRTAISVGLACQILGGVLATVLAGRVRYIAVFWACAVALFSTWAVYALGAPAGLFIAVTGLAGVCGGLGGPFLVPMTIEADPSRRAAVQSGAVQLLAGALGPLLAALVVSERDAHGVLMLAAALLVAGLAIIMGLHRANRRAAAR
ncbi:MFS transporter [Phenylobacterium sp.]|uniref:MFS transporter n=1 Tax=Phenylobacterium sp. TaxID=1871053 RepID=UPI00374D6818